jgi:hypothetical protein
MRCVPRVLIVLTLLLLILALGWVVLRPWANSWGASPALIQSALPGDGIVTRPGLESTRAIRIAAPPGDVWPWLCQIGQSRGGFYSYAWLENLFGCDIRNADTILPECQDLAVGDGIRLHPDVPPLPVAALETGHHLVLAGLIDPRTGQIAPLGTDVARNFVPACWAMVLREGEGGATQLVLRFRLARPPGLPFWIAYRFLLEPITFVMERKMLLGIRARAQRSR